MGENIPFAKQSKEKERDNGQDMHNWLTSKINLNVGYVTQWLM